jgi:RNA polymerase sigma factor (sigma-70 family)
MTRRDMTNLRLRGDGPPPPAMTEAVNDDARDVSAARAGDARAFARLYDRHAPVVHSLCRRAVPASLDDADDALQETFIRAFRMLGKLDEPDGLRPWLYAIARRVCSERRRAAIRRRHHEGCAMTTNASISTIDPPAAPAAAERDESLDRLTDALERLDERERLAVHLYYLETDPVRAAAHALGLSRSGYYKLLARARDRLAHHMREATTP